jgi:UDP-N-acetylglucosamine 4,6-dehydratase
MSENKVILLTGGTGSFGQKFVEIALKEYNPKAIRIFSRGELLQMQMQQRFNDSGRLRFFIGDVRDKERISRAMNGVDIVVHAAALKQVPTSEYNPLEAVKTNINGAANVIDSAIDNNVERVINISTDKAVQPVNLYGATKLVAEKLFTQGNAYTGARRIRFGSVRYGNVVGSRGSVIPLFLEQKKLGKITITDERMTRFWITIEQGVRFVIDCVGRLNRGETFIPKIPSMKIASLADAIAPGVEKEIIGIRPGEKLHEMLISREDAIHTKEFDGYYVVEPEHSFWKSDYTSGSKPLPTGFTYTSDNNDKWLTTEELKKIIKRI